MTSSLRLTIQVHSASRSLHKKRLTQEAYASLREQTVRDLSGRSGGGSGRPPLVGAESTATSVDEEGSDASSLYSGPSIPTRVPQAFHQARVATLSCASSSSPYGEKTVV